MRFGIIYLITFSFYSFPSLSQGGRSEAMSNSNVTLQDEAAVYNNIAGVAVLKNLSSICSYHYRFGVVSLNTVEAGIILPLKYGTATVDVIRFGNNLYNELRMGVGFAHQLNNVSLGGKISYYQVHIKEYTTKGIVIFEFGGIAEILPHLTFGAHIYNFNQAAYSKEAQKMSPVTMKAGLGFKPIETILVTVEVEKSLQYQPRFKAGLEYRLIPRLFLRTGISTKPINNSFGFGLLLKHLKVDYALTSFQRIGFHHALSLSWNFKKGKR